MIVETDSAPPTVTGVSGLVDVHMHFPAGALRRAWERAGVTRGGAGLPVWNAEEALDVMGDVGIEFAVLSPPSLPGGFTDVDDSRRTAREFNEDLADQIADDPGSFGGVALLPLPHVDAALEELAYALDVLKLEGAHVFTDYQGRTPGHGGFAPLLDELNRRRTTVMTHPTSAHGVRPAAGEAPVRARPECAAETTRLVADLRRGCALDRYPDIRWILAHDGAGASQRPDPNRAEVAGDPYDRDDAAPGPRGLYVVVACHVDGSTLSGLVAVHGPGRLLFGSEMPFESGAGVARRITTLMGGGAVDDVVKRAVGRDNALALFPSVVRKLRNADPPGTDYCQ